MKMRCHEYVGMYGYRVSDGLAMQEPQKEFKV